MLRDDTPSLAHQRADSGGDYDYYWSGAGLEMRVPVWLAEILELPRGIMISVFLFGLFLGIIVVGLAVLVGFYFAVG